jgi:hypothetical protein
LINKVKTDTEEAAADMMERIKAHADGNASAIQVWWPRSPCCLLLPNRVP